MNPKIVLPLAVLGLAAAGAALLVATSSPVAGRPSEREIRAVRVIRVETRTVQLEVRSQGTVVPRTESELIPEVSGRVVWTSPNLVSGGYFEAGDPLLRIGRADHEASVSRAQAALARARVEAKHAQQTLLRRKTLSDSGVASGADLDEAERASRVGEADVRDSRVALEQAERDLERTELYAPFDGRVRDERVDVGQFLNRGQAYATLYATDFVEVRLPIADAQLAYLELPIWERRTDPEESLPEVRLNARFAGREYVWTGQVVRTEGEIDTKSRLVHVVARVANDGDAETPPLPVGLFVQARIAGRNEQEVAVIPREALQSSSRVFVVDDENRLRFRDVEVLRIESDQALIRSGLEAGDRVCVSPIHTPVNGMQVRPVAPVEPSA